MGDGLLMSFNSCRDAVLLAIELQKMGKPYKLRISIHQGDILHEDGKSINKGHTLIRLKLCMKYDPMGTTVGFYYRLFSRLDYPENLSFK